MIIVVVGNPIDGFRYFGPFANSQAACNWMEGVDESCWLDEVMVPE